MRTFSKLAAVTAVAVATVAVVRKYDLIAKGAVLAEQGVEKVAAGAEWATAKATELVDKALTWYADDETDDAEAEAEATAQERLVHTVMRTAQEQDMPFVRKADGANAVSYGDVR